MKKNLYLHIGFPKTGTTSIQSFFASNRGVGLKHNLLYPKTGIRNGTHFELSDALGFKLRIKWQPDPVRMPKLKSAFARECAANHADNILVSSENFVLAGSPLHVKSFFEDFEVRIVIYLRRHDSWWESKYWQATRMVTLPRWERGPEGYIHFLKHQKNKGAHYIKYRHIVDQWAETFGPENIILRPYERSQMERGAVVDLLQALDMTEFADSDFVRDARPLNESKSFRSLRLIEAYQRIDVPEKTRKRLIDHALKIPGNKEPGFLTSPALRRQLVEENMEEYRYLAKTYLGRDDGIMFYEPLPDADEAWTPAAPLLELDVIERTLAAVS